jgi:hypothetical protein
MAKSAAAFKELLQRPQILAIIIFLNLLSSVSHLPPYESIFVAERNLMALSHLILGMLDFPVRLIAFFSLSRSRDWYLIIYHFGWFVCSIPIADLALQLWKSQRQLLIVLMIFNASLGACGVLFGAILVQGPISSCRHDISASRTIRISAYREIGWSVGEDLFFQFSNDGGNTWTQILHENYDNVWVPNIMPDCTRIKSNGQDLIGIWDGFNFVYTANGGNSWDRFDYYTFFKDGRRDNIGSIRDVDLSTDQITITFPAGVNKNPLVLITTDRGHTWHESNE